jgi:hypothetical protein
MTLGMRIVVCPKPRVWAERHLSLQNAVNSKPNIAPPNCRWRKEAYLTILLGNGRVSSEWF